MQAFCQEPASDGRSRVQPRANLPIRGRMPDRFAIDLGGFRYRNDSKPNTREIRFQAKLHCGAPPQPHEQSVSVFGDFFGRVAIERASFRRAIGCAVGRC
jgi:hypothetical protein